MTNYEVCKLLRVRADKMPKEEKKREITRQEPVTLGEAVLFNQNDEAVVCLTAEVAVKKWLEIDGKIKLGAKEFKQLWNSIKEADKAFMTRQAAEELCVKIVETGK